MPRDRTSTTVVAGVFMALAIVVGGCSSSSDNNATATTVASSTTTAAPAKTAAVLFSPEGNNLWAYETTPPFRKQKVNTANHTFGDAPSDPKGWDINGQVCAFSVGPQRFLITGEDTHQPDPPAGWGIFEVAGSRVGDFGITRVARLVPTYQPTPDNPDNYGCGVLSDGRIVTSDIGNEASDAANGQLTIWFPPYDSTKVAYCKLDLHLATGQGIYVDADDNLYLNSPRPSPDPQATSGGVFKYTGPYPTGADAAHGCGKVDNLGSPLADSITKTRVLSSGDHGLVSPSGITRGPNGHFFVPSVITGTINEYDANWKFVQTVLQPPVGEKLGDEPYSTGTPLGITVGSDGSLFYADIGIVTGGTHGFGPGKSTGSVRRITFVNGKPQPPETLADQLQFPDGVGLNTWKATAN